VSYLLDTDICIYLIKRQPKALVQRLMQQDPANVAISSLTLAELEYGVQKSAAVAKNREALELFTAPFEVVVFDADAARAYGAIRADLERRGKPIGGIDMLLAGQALALQATLVTNNMREFSRVRGLSVENWTRG
jgi:tRNA(fMet)-specific endonuclease VapC